MSVPQSETKPDRLGTVLILLAGIFWGSMGIFVRRLSAVWGFNSFQIVSIRVTLAAVCFSVILLIRNPKEFRISLRDFPLFLGLGLASILFFTVCYFTAITKMSLSAAAVLLYTSPIWVMLMSLVFFREKMTRRKLFALLLAFGGCVLVSGFSGGGVTPVGLLLGLGSGIGYGLYSILGTVALRRYSPYTVTAWTFLIAAVGSWFFCEPADMLSRFASASSLSSLCFFCLVTAVITAVIPFLFYTLGLRSVEASRAAILATVEPMVATLFGVFLFSERLTLSSALGVALILGSVILLNLGKENPKENHG